MEISEDFAVAVSTRGDQHVVDVSGELDADSGPTLSETIGAIQHDGAMHVVVDLREVTFIDSKGLSALLVAWQQLATREMTMSVTNLQPAVERLFRISGLDAVLLNADEERDSAGARPSSSGASQAPSA